MADKEAAKLAKEIVKEAFGDVVGSVASILIDRGRLHVAEICYYTRLKARTVQAVLITLIQHNLAFYSEQPLMGNLVEYFELNLKECLMRLRWGRIVAMTEEEFGEEAREIIQFILLRGKARLPEILQGLGVQDAAGKARMTATLYRLLTSHHVLPTSPSLYIAPFDDITAKRKAAEKLHPGVLSAKEMDALRQRVVDEVRAARLEEQLPEKAFIESSTSAAKKRKQPNGHDGPVGKKTKVEEHPQINPQTLLRVNYEKYNVKMRNQILVDACADRWNPAAAGVLRAFLTAALPRHLHVKQAYGEPLALTAALQQLSEIDRDMLSFGLGASKMAPRKRIGEIAAAFAELLSGQDDMGSERADGVFLAKDAIGARATGGAYRVPFERVCERLKRQLLDSFVEERWGPEAKRVVRVLSQGQKLAEATIQNKALMKLDRVRSVCALLHEHNVIELQQVPKGTDRLATRSNFLWFIEPNHAYTTLLSVMYKSLGNIAQRRATEIEKKSAVLERASRSDVIAGEARLSDRDVRELAELDEELDKLAIAEMRTEMNVLLLRDLPGGRQSIRYDDPFAI